MKISPIIGILFSFEYSFAQIQDPYIFFNPQDLDPSLVLPLLDRQVTIHPKISTLQKRLKFGRKNYKIEPLLTRPAKKASPQVIPSSKQSIKKPVSKTTFKRLRSIQDSLKAYHHELLLDLESMSEKNWSDLLDQTQAYLTFDQFQSLQDFKMTQDFKDSKHLFIEEFLLPPFAKRMVTQYLIFRGPNCFQSALGFQDPQFYLSKAFNVHEEPGYHRAMINNDELLYTLTQAFHPIDPQLSRLRYGDIIIFLDIPTEDFDEIPYRTIKHATVYLFNTYTFSKGSKSANHPYTIQTLSTEYDKWQHRYPRLGIKVFRRNQSHGMVQPSRNLKDWL